MRNPIKLLQKLLVTKKETFELVDNLRESSDLSDDQTNMLGNLLQLGNIQISDIMVPRADIVSININSSFKDTLNLFLEAAHSRMPVYKEQLDNIVGMIHVKDLLPYWHKNSEFSINKVKRNPLPWVEEMINSPIHTNFFENRSTDYSKGALTGSWGNVWGKAA